MFCKECGSKLPDGASTCTNCGAALTRSAAATRELHRKNEVTLSQVVTQVQEDEDTMSFGNNNVPKNDIRIPHAPQPQPQPQPQPVHAPVSVAPAAADKDNKIVVVALVLAVILVIVAGAIGVAMFSNNSSTKGKQSFAVVTVPANSSTSSSSSNQTPIFSRVVASSTLAPVGSNYYVAENLVDGRDETCWSENGGGPGIGEYVEFSADTAQHVSKIRIMNGYCKTEDLFYENCRLKTVDIYVDGDWFCTANVPDGYKTTTDIILEGGIDANEIRISIKEAYTGTKYQDTCISRIEFY